MSDGPTPEPNESGGADASGSGADALPDDLDVTAYVGPYQFPGTHRRRIAGTLYLIVGVVCALVAALTGNAGLVAAAVLLVLIGGYHYLAAWHLRVDQTEALTVASRTVGFPVGHASGQLGFRGLRSRPSWRILLFSADDPPSMRGLVELDGVDGTVLGEYTELNPEDWSQYGLDAPADGPSA
ncbi:MAG: hypothetical protein WDA60_15985 [Acidimicrobiia bacterium]